MNKSKSLKRTAILLIAVLALTSLPVFAFDDVTAEPPDTYDAALDASAGQEEKAEEAPELTSESVQDASAPDKSLPEGSEKASGRAGVKAAGEREAEKPGEISGFKVISRSGNSLTLEWDMPENLPEGAVCMVFRKDRASGVKVNEGETTYTFSDLSYNTQYSFRVAYFAEDKETELTKCEWLETKSAVEPPVKRSVLSNTLSPSRLTSYGSYYNLREYANEGIYGYAIIEGSCTDGTYSYHCLVNTNSNWGKIVKVRMSDNACVAVSNPYNFSHGNGMCYDSKRRRIVVASYDDYRRTITFVNPDNLNDITQGKLILGEKMRERMADYGDSVGATAISYNAKYDCYVVMQKIDYNVVIYDANTLRAKAVALTDFDVDHSGVFQSIDSDDSYVYFLLSKDGSTQPDNLIIAFDWHSEKLEALLNGNSTEDMWWCGNNGEHAAVITVNGAHEIESMYHTDAGGGRGHFYLANYNNDPTYKTVKYKVKWKKVTKKVKVKWKKVKKKVKWKKVNGKWKYKTKKVWKYKYKKKKVWKYKTKKKKVFSHYNRDNYILDLGVF